MSTIIRRKHTRRGLTAYKAYELLWGQIWYSASGYSGALSYSGYGDGNSTDIEDYISDEMRADWEENRDMLMDFWKRGDQLLGEFFLHTPPWLNDKPDPDEPPWAARQFD